MSALESHGMYCSHLSIYHGKLYNAIMERTRVVYIPCSVYVDVSIAKPKHASGPTPGPKHSYKHARSNTGAS